MINTLKSEKKASITTIFFLLFFITGCGLGKQTINTSHENLTLKKDTVSWYDPLPNGFIWR